MYKKILTTITTIPGYPEIQFWTDGSVTYQDNNEYVLITEPTAILNIVNKMRDVPAELLSIDALKQYVEERPKDILLQTLYTQMKPLNNNSTLFEEPKDMERE